MRRVVASWLLVMLSSGCQPTSWLVEQQLVGGRHVKHVLKQAAVISDSDGNREQLFHYYIRICDLDGEGNHLRCADSLILRDVSVGPR